MEIKSINDKILNLGLVVIFFFQIVLGITFIYFAISISEWSILWTILTMVNFTLFAWLFVKYLNKVNDKS